MEFRYPVIRVWQVPAEGLLTGGLSTLPLVPISALPEADLPAAVRQIDERLGREATSEQAAVLGAAAFLLTGLRLPPSEVRRLYQGVRFMSIVKDSSAYQIILEEGRAEGKKEGAIEEARNLADPRPGTLRPGGPSHRGRPSRADGPEALAPHA